MPGTERIRQLLKELPKPEDIEERTAAGWRLVAMEWERDVDRDVRSAGDVPFGLKVVPDTATVETDPTEWQALVLMMEMTVQEGPYWSIAEELNRRGFRTRQGDPWTPVSVFQMLPRLIEVGPKIFATDEWRRRRERRGI